VSVTDATAKISVSIAVDTKALEDVVVIGYATVKKKDVTGAVAGIGQAELKSRPVDNALQAMQGKVAGVDISLTKDQVPLQVLISVVLDL